MLVLPLQRNYLKMKIIYEFINIMQMILNMYKN